MKNKFEEKQASCSYCGDEFTSKKRAKAWSEYCPKCVKKRVWYRKRSNLIDNVVED